MVNKSPNVFELLAVIVVVLIIGGGITYGNAYMEARAYNRITGANVSAWDAMFVNLRVDTPASK